MSKFRNWLEEYFGIPTDKVGDSTSVKTAPSNSNESNEFHVLRVQPTPNPNAFQFVINMPIIASGTKTFENADEAKGDFFAEEPFQIYGVESIYLKESFVTVTKSETIGWHAIFEKVGETIDIVGFGQNTSTVITGVEMFHKTLDEGLPGDAVGCLVRGIEREDVARGAVLAKPGTLSPHTKAKAQVYVLTKEEGGRHTPFFSGYKPQFYIRTTDVTGEIKLADGVEMVMPGDNTEMDISLMYPVALEENLRFAIREGGRTVGSGVVTKVVE